MVMCAAGGDFVLEMLPYVNSENIVNNPKWIMGASDPTSLLYYVTTKFDIATLYGHNAGSYDAINLDKSNLISLEYLKGNLIKQDSYPLYESDKKSRTKDGYKLDKVIVIDDRGETIEIKEDSFIMPNSNVTIEAIFIVDNPNTSVFIGIGIGIGFLIKWLLVL